MRCSSCNAFISKRFFSYHKRYCIKKNDTNRVFGIPMTNSNNLSLKLSPKFLSDIVSKFRQDPVGNVCREDEIILYVGAKLYNKLSVKSSKKSGVNKRIRHEMRTLGLLYLSFKENHSYQSTYGTVIDMFLPKNFSLFTETVENVTNSEDNDDSMKSSLVQDIFYLVQKSVKMYRAYYSMKEDDELSKKLETPFCIPRDTTSKKQGL